VGAVWSFSSTDHSGVFEREAAGTLKRRWVNNGRSGDRAGTDGEGREFLPAATAVKNIWVPCGE